MPIQPDLPAGAGFQAPPAPPPPPRPPPPPPRPRGPKLAAAGTLGPLGRRVGGGAGQLLKLALRRDADDVPRQSAALQQRDDHAGEVPLPPAQPMERRA